MHKKYFNYFSTKQYIRVEHVATKSFTLVQGLHQAIKLHNKTGVSQLSLEKLPLFYFSGDDQPSQGNLPNVTYRLNNPNRLKAQYPSRLLQTYPLKQAYNEQGKIKVVYKASKMVHKAYG